MDEDELPHETFRDSGCLSEEMEFSAGPARVSQEVRVLESLRKGLRVTFHANETSLDDPYASRYPVRDLPTCLSELIPVYVRKEKKIQEAEQGSGLSHQQSPELQGTKDGRKIGTRCRSIRCLILQQPRPNHEISTYLILLRQGWKVRTHMLQVIQRKERNRLRYGWRDNLFQRPIGGCR